MNPPPISVEDLLSLLRRRQTKVWDPDEGEGVGKGRRGRRLQAATKLVLMQNSAIWTDFMVRSGGDPKVQLDASTSPCGRPCNVRKLCLEIRELTDVYAE